MNHPVITAALADAHRRDLLEHANRYRPSRRARRLTRPKQHSQDAA
jgi:hypothetical protein